MRLRLPSTEIESAQKHRSRERRREDIDAESGAMGEEME